MRFTHAGRSGSCPRPPKHRARRMRRAVLLAAAIAIAPALASAIEIESSSAGLHWDAASGPVEGYRVFVTRNGQGGSAPSFSVSTTSATLTGEPGDEVVVRVAAFDAEGNEGPLSPASEVVMFVAPPPAAPETIAVLFDADTSILAALGAAAPGEQLSAQLVSEGKQLLDAAIPHEVEASELWGLDQLVVGGPGEPATVRLVDSIGLESPTPMDALPELTLFGLGSGDPCDRDGEPGLVIHPGSLLVLGGIDLHAFDGERCVHVNELFAQSDDPNRIDWGDGEIALHGDLEDDGVLDPDDNCLLVANPAQCDTDADGFGNQCDTDVSQDGFTDLVDFHTAWLAKGERSPDARFDINCDGGFGLDDIHLIKEAAGSLPGPSGLACAAEASCEDAAF